MRSLALSLKRVVTLRVKSVRAACSSGLSRSQSDLLISDRAGELAVAQVLEGLRWPLTIIALGAALIGCGSAAQRQYQSAADSLMSEGCRSLAAVIEQREAFGIMAPSQETDEDALRSCGLPHSSGGGPPFQTTPYRSAAMPPSKRDQLISSADEVPIGRHGNTYTVPVRVNQTITLPFVLDTGATDLVIPADVALTLIRAGALTSNDFIGKSQYSMANGSEQVSDRVIIREVQVGDDIVRMSLRS